jgi:hypothetical protein
VLFRKIATGGRMTNHGHFATGRPISIGPPHCTPRSHENQQAGGRGRAGTAGGRWGDVSYDVFFLETLQRGGG